MEGETAEGLLAPSDVVLEEVAHLTSMNRDQRTTLALSMQKLFSLLHAKTDTTIASYARSARAFFQWAVRHTSLESTPFAHLPLLKVNPPLLQTLEPEQWECLLLACRPPGETNLLAVRATVRNQAILWMLADTGMRVLELCGLHLSDVTRKGGIVTVKEKGSKQRQVPLGQNGRDALLSYLDQRHPEAVEGRDQRETYDEPLFLSEAGHPLTANGIALLFGRFRKRAGITRKGVGPALLRETFAVRS